MRASILVVDDEIEILKAIKRALMDEFTIHTYTSANEALNFFEFNPTHIVISDMKMPKIIF